MTRYSCANERRLLAVKLAGLLNGIEYVEVRDTDESDPLKKALRQRTLYVRLLLPVPVPPDPDALTALNVVIDGGERIGSVGVEWAVAATALPGRRGRPGDRPRAARPRPGGADRGAR